LSAPAQGVAPAHITIAMQLTQKKSLTVTAPESPPLTLQNATNGVESSSEMGGRIFVDGLRERP